MIKILVVLECSPMAWQKSSKQLVDLTLSISIALSSLSISNNTNTNTNDLKFQSDFIDYVKKNKEVIKSILGDDRYKLFDVLLL